MHYCTGHIGVGFLQCADNVYPQSIKMSACIIALVMIFLQCAINVSSQTLKVVHATEHKCCT